MIIKVGRPREKAKQLVQIYINDMPNLQHQTGNTIIEHAKNCSLIAIREIVAALHHYSVEQDEFEKMAEYFEYWANVKEELEKL